MGAPSYLHKFWVRCSGGAPLEPSPRKKRDQSKKIQDPRIARKTAALRAALRSSLQPPPPPPPLPAQSRQIARVERCLRAQPTKQESGKNNVSTDADSHAARGVFPQTKGRPQGLSTQDSRLCAFDLTILRWIGRTKWPACMPRRAALLHDARSRGICSTWRASLWWRRSKSLPPSTELFRGMSLILPAGSPELARATINGFLPATTGVVTIAVSC